MSQLVLAFDIYGTLFDTDRMSQALDDQLYLHNREKASQVSSLWRRYQLEYTWRLNSMDLYEPFDVVTTKSLQHALKESGIKFSTNDVNKLMDSYNTLPCFPEANSSLEKLIGSPNVKIVIFSNGTRPMVKAALEAARMHDVASDIFVADAVGRYKPSPHIYQALAKAFGKGERPWEVFLVSGNPFDVAGALSQGMRAVWVDRAGEGWSDGFLSSSLTRWARITIEKLKAVKGIDITSLAATALKVINGLDELPEFVADILNGCNSMEQFA